MLVDIVAQGEGKPAIKVTGMPGKHIAPGVIGTLNDLISAVSSEERDCRWTYRMQIADIICAGTSNEWMDD